MNEEHQIALIAWGLSTALVLLAYCFYRIAKATWRSWQGMYEQGYLSMLTAKIRIWVRVHARLLQLVGFSLGNVLAIVCMVLPIIGARGFFEVFRIPYSRDLHFKLLGSQLLGPTFLLLLGVTLLVFAIRHKRIPWAFCVFGVIGAIFTALTAGDIAHDFSHVVFDRCGTFYGTVTSWLCIFIAGGHVLACLADLSRRIPERQPQRHPPLSNPPARQQ